MDGEVYHLLKYLYGVIKSKSWLRPRVSVFNLRMSVCSSINLSMLLEKSPFKIALSRSDIYVYMYLYIIYIYICICKYYLHVYVV